MSGRTRPYISASEQPRPYGDVLAERAAYDVEAQQLRRVLDEIAALEAAAAEATGADERKRLQCEAEDLRCTLTERSGRA